MTTSNGLRRPLPCWISLICQDTEKTNSGDYVAEVIEALNDYPLISAVGVNCIHPGNAIKLIETVRKY